MKTGTRLRSLAGRVCSRATMDRLIDPLIADMQSESDQGTRRGQPWARRRILMQGYLGFWRVLAVHVPIVCIKRTLRPCTASDRRAVKRGVGSAALTMTLLTALLIAPPLQGVARRDGQIAWQLLLLLPQSFPLSLPLSLLVGVLCGLPRRPVTIPLRHALLVVGLAGSLASIGTIKWLIPAANHAFRVTTAGRDLVRGPGEMPLGSLRQQGLVMKNDGRLDKAGGLLLNYHLRSAIAGAALVFVLFGLGVAALRTGRAATAGLATVGCIVYGTYVFELRLIPASVFSDERVAFALAWLPNILLAVTSVAFLSADQPHLPDDFPEDEDNRRSGAQKISS
jgi:lipopolysaccharide export system permease LptF/LptG-like protein